MISFHGGAGDDAISGGGAPGAGAVVGKDLGVSQLYDASGNLLNRLARIDFDHPFNPGDALHFGEDADAWHSTNHIASRLGEFALYDEYDPRASSC